MLLQDLLLSQVVEMLMVWNIHVAYVWRNTGRLRGLDLLLLVLLLLFGV
jgi:hypothetical protein